MRNSKGDWERDVREVGERAVSLKPSEKKMYQREGSDQILLRGKEV